MKSVKINKTLEAKADAEKVHGFNLYQGGIVPGNELRIVEIEGVDVEACCGTHCDTTAEVGWIKILNTKRIADGIVRIYFVAGERTLEELNEEANILNELCNIWSVPQNQIVDNANKIFKKYKKRGTEVDEARKKILDLQVRYVIDRKDIKGGLIKSDEPNATPYFSFLNNYAVDLRDADKSIVFYSDSFIFGFFPSNKSIDVNEIKGRIGSQGDVKVMNVFGPKNKQIKDCVVLSIMSKTGIQNVEEIFKGTPAEPLNI